MKIFKIYTILLVLLSLSISSYSQSCSFCIGKVIEVNGGKLIDAKDVIVNILDSNTRYNTTIIADTTDDEGYYIIDLNNLTSGPYKLTYFKNNCIKETRYYTIAELLADSLKTIIMPEQMVIYVSNDTNICAGGIGSQITIYAEGGTGYSWSNEEETDSINITPMTTATYQVTVNNEEGCTASDEVIVNVSKANAGIVYFVDGVSVVDEASPKNVAVSTYVSVGSTNTNCTYSWSTGVSTETIKVISYTTGTNTYTLTVTENECTDIDTVVLNVVNLIAGTCDTTTTFVSNLTSTNAQIHWNNANYATGYMVRYRVYPSGTFVYFNGSSLDSIWSLSGLTANTTYEFQIRAFCDGGYYSNFTALKQFTTLGTCPTPTNLSAYDITATKAVLSWDAVTGAHHYYLMWRVLNGTWNYVPYIAAPTHIIQIGCGVCDPEDQLIPDTFYEWQVKTFCDSLGSYYSNFSAIDTFLTLSAKRGSEDDIVAKSNLNEFSCNLYPNPTHSNATIDLYIPQNTYVKIELYNILGSKISDIYKGNNPKGSYKYTVNTYGLKPDTYIVKIVANKTILHERLIIME